MSVSEAIPNFVPIKSIITNKEFYKTVKMKYNRHLFILSLLLLSSFSLFGQVTIGSGSAPAKGALLQLKDQEPDSENRTSTKGGLLLPRIKLESRNSLEPIIDEFDTDLPNLKKSHVGLMVYNLTETPPTVKDPDKILKPGIYTWDGALWTMHIDNTHSAGAKYFYMPSFNLPISSTGTGKTFNLYDEYVKQFRKAGNTRWVSSNSALVEIQEIYPAAELDYVVTGMADDTVIKINSISSEGVMNYDVLQTTADPGFYINIILVVK